MATLELLHFSHDWHEYREEVFSAFSFLIGVQFKFKVSRGMYYPIFFFAR